MATPIRFFNKNKLDISNPNAELTASEADAYVDYVRNRSNTSYWVTTNSVDANNTNIVVDFADQRDIDSIILVKHNFKAYTVQYWNGVAYDDFSTPILETNNSSDTTFHQFNLVVTTRIKLTIQGTMIADRDKFLAQLIATDQIGQLENYPSIRKPSFDRNLASTNMLSGKASIIENIGGFSVSLDKEYWKSAADLELIEELYFSNEGFLVWLSGGDTSQFNNFIPRGYRMEDVFLMKCANNYSPEYVKGILEHGIGVAIKLIEVVD
jgi:hypothetical protein